MAVLQTHTCFKAYFGSKNVYKDYLFLKFTASSLTIKLNIIKMLDLFA